MNPMEISQLRQTVEGHSQVIESLLVIVESNSILLDSMAKHLPNPDNVCNIRHLKVVR